MKIKKTYETVLNLSPVEMYSNIDEIVLHKLKENFEGTCKENSLIVKILEIVKRSKCRISKNHLDGSGSVNVLYTAEAITYQPGDILSVCEIMRVEKNHKILCKYDEHTVAWINGGKALRGLRIGQKISILILGTKYGKEKNSIIVYGVPYVYPNKFYVFTASDSSSDITGEDAVIIQMKMEELSRETEQFEKTNTKIKKFFSELYYPFRKKASDIQSTFSKQIKVEHLEAPIEIEKGLLYFRHPMVDKSTDVVLSISAENFKKQEDNEIFHPDMFKIEMIEESSIRILLYMLDDYIKFIHLIYELCIAFETEESISEQSNIWDIYKRVKKP
jgi:hypothetical protein